MSATTATNYSASSPHAASFIVYINGLEVPAKSVSLRYGVWQVPEMSIEMVADPVLVRLGSEDRVQVAVFYYDDCDVAPGVQPAFRLFGEGEITAWGYRNTSGGRSIIFSVVNQIQVFSQLFVHFLTTLDDMVGHATGPDDVTGISNASSQLVYPYALFNQGLIPVVGSDKKVANRIVRPFDYLYNTVRGMMAKNIPEGSRTIPAANFFTRWARLTNFHNRFAASPFFDEGGDANVFPVLRALQNVSGIDVVVQKLLPQIQNSGSLWDMLQTVYSTMLMEVAMIPGMPLVTVDLGTGLVAATDFSEHQLVYDPARVGPPAWVPALADASRKLKPKRLQNYFPKQQMLFSIPPSCNVIFPSQVLNIAYEEVFATQPTRLYFNDETITNILKIPKDGVGNETIMNSLAIAYPPEADLINKARGTTNPKFNGKNILLYPEEFYKGPVMDRRTIPFWLFTLKGSENKTKSGTPTSPVPSDNVVAPTPTPPQTGSTPAPKPTTTRTAGPQMFVKDAAGAEHQVMITQSENGTVGPDGRVVYWSGTELLRDRIAAAIQGTAIPLDYMLAWCNLESGGRPYEGFKDLINEGAGVFQFTAEECTKSHLNFPHGVAPRALVDQPSLKVAADTSIRFAIDYILDARKVADALAASVGINWSQADMWRLTKFRTHGLPGYGKVALFEVKQALGRPPRDWEEFYFKALETANGLKRKTLNNGTAVGAAIPGASGWTVSASMKTPYHPGAPLAAPPAVASAATTRTDAPAAPTAPEVDPATRQAIANDTEDVYHLYAKFEYFRERYAKRSGSANISWNPYVVPGFPGAIFDSRASRVDLMVYITTVQHQLSHAGTRSTTLSYLYGRQFQEMFDTMALEFSQSDATARGTAPQEPVRDVSKIVQSFAQSEQYYERLFYGAQKLFNKDAAFDYRKIVAFAPRTPGSEPERIIITGPDAGSDDAKKSAETSFTTLSAARDKISATLIDLKARLAAAQSVLTTIPPSGTTEADTILSTIQLAQRTEVQSEVAILQVQLVGALTQLTSLDLQLRQALQTIQENNNSTGSTRVEHNLDGTRELVPLPSAQALFDNRDAAMRYNWRPICTLDEYIVFYDTAGIGVVPAFGDPRSVGARYFDRIRTLTPPTEDFIPPADIDGLRGATVSGLTSGNFPQIRADWDKALQAYKDNVLNVKAPRT